ncbi:MAG: GNAT family protein [Hyphomicrobium sp.]|jgi:ribosomal-protein-alanine N-acetyltransferase
MAFLRAGSAHDALILQGRCVYLRPLQLGDYAAWAELRSQSRAHLVPWEPAWSMDDLTKASFRRRVRHYQKEALDDLGYALLIFETEGARLVGGLTLSHLKRGVTQSATLGYWLGAPYVGRGYMSDAVRAILPYTFETLSLHRIEASVQPTNEASLRVLDRVGFRREGMARGYLKINGQWQDHVLFAMLADEWIIAGRGA